MNSRSASFSLACLVLSLSGCATSAPGGALLSGGGARAGAPSETASFTRATTSTGASESLHGVEESPERQQVLVSDRGARRLSRYDVSGAFTEPVAEGRSVPAFRLSSQRDDDTHELVGSEAFVVVFFATWCELCVPKLETVKRAMSAVPGARLLLVSVDDDKTASHVPGFLRERRLEQVPLVGGLEHPDFLRSYNPTSSLPAVTVVDRAGVLVEVQEGLFDGDGRRLETALHRAVAP